MKVRILNRADLIKVLDIKDVIEGVKNVYKWKTEGKTSVWPHVIHHFDEEPKGVMDIKSGYVGGDVKLHGAKMLNTFWGNANTEIPIFNGLMMVFDSTTGAPLSMLDASYITSMRTGAAGAIGVEAMSRKNTETLFILGAGRQASFQLAATLNLMPQIKKVYVCDAITLENARKFAKEMPDLLVNSFGIENRKYVEFVPVEDMEKDLKDSDAIITITPAREPVIKAEWLKEGVHLSCVGADMSGKQEIYGECFMGARIIADDIEQTMKIGEMEIPLKDGIIKPSDIAGEIGDVLLGTIDGRKSEQETTIFDATGIALLDIATAKIAYEKAEKLGIGTIIEW